MIWTQQSRGSYRTKSIYNIRRDYEKRVELAERALELNPNHPACNHDYGLAITNHGRFDDALAHIFKAVKMDPARHRNYETILPLIIWQG